MLLRHYYVFADCKTAKAGFIRQFFTQLVRSLRHPLEICQRAEEAVDVGEVGDVVAEVGHRRLVDR